MNRKILVREFFHFDSNKSESEMNWNLKNYEFKKKYMVISHLKISRKKKGEIWGLNSNKNICDRRKTFFVKFSTKKWHIHMLDLLEK